MRRTIRLVLAVTTATVTATACGGAPAPASTTPSAALAAPQPTAAQRPVQDSQLTPGVRYRFEDVVAPHVLDVELIAPTPPVWSYHAPTVTVLSTSETAEVNALWFIDPDELRVPVDPYFSTDSLASQEDFLRLSRDAPDDVLPYFAQLDFFETTQPIRPITIAGNPGRALDVAVRELPDEATECAYGSLTKCAYITLLPGIGQNVESGQHYRIIDLQLPFTRVLITQNLDIPGAQTALDTASFLPGS